MNYYLKVHGNIHMDLLHEFRQLPFDRQVKLEKIYIL